MRHTERTATVAYASFHAPQHRIGSGGHTNTTICTRREPTDEPKPIEPDYNIRAYDVLSSIDFYATELFFSFGLCFGGRCARSIPPHTNTHTGPCLDIAVCFYRGDNSHGHRPSTLCRIANEIEDAFAIPMLVRAPIQQVLAVCASRMPLIVITRDNYENFIFILIRAIRVGRFIY